MQQSLTFGKPFKGNERNIVCPSDTTAQPRDNWGTEVLAGWTLLVFSLLKLLAGGLG